MIKRILWIDDDYFALQGLFRPIEKQGFVVDAALSASEGYRKALNWKNYYMIIADLILPITQDTETLPVIVNSWQSENFPGIGLLKWLVLDLKVTCPIMLLTIETPPSELQELQALGNIHYQRKNGLLPNEFKNTILKILQES